MYGCFEISKLLLVVAPLIVDVAERVFLGTCRWMVGCLAAPVLSVVLFWVELTHQ